MRTALRKMGNSTGVIIPRTALSQAGLTTGTGLDVSVEGNRIVLTPLKEHPRAGWAEAAAAIADEEDPEAAEWRAFGNEADSELTW